MTPRQLTLATIGLGLLLACGGGGGGGSSAPSPAPAPLQCVRGSVSAIATGDDGTVYVGGQFNRVSEFVGAAVTVDLVTGERSSPTLTTDGQILTCLSDGSGGYYLGGAFTQVNGAARKGLARILADGTVDPLWKPEIEEGAVVTMIHVGGSIFFGGYFQRVNGFTRTSLAIVDDTYGSLVSTAPVLTSNGPSNIAFVRELLMDGTTLYVAGAFTGAGNTSPATPRSNAAAFDGNNNVLPWAPEPNHSVSQMLKIGNTIYLRGEFSKMGLADRNELAAVDATTGAVTAWDPVPPGDAIDVKSMQPRYRFMGPTTLLVGGTFHTMGGQPRDHLAELSLTTGAATAWNPDPDQHVDRILTIDDGLQGTQQVFLCGDFETIGGAARSGLAEVTLGTGEATPWNADLSGNIANSLRIGQNLLLVGTLYTAGATRQNLAAFDAEGRLQAWAPTADAPVEALCWKDGLLYAGGAFTTIGAIPRRGLAALDRLGNLDTWDPIVEGGTVNTLAAKDNLIFAGGWFTGVGAQSHPLLAAIDAQSGRPLSGWTPITSTTTYDRIRGLAVSGNTLYVAGFFDADFTHCLRAVDIPTGQLTPWLPAAGGEQYDVAAHGSHVLACGAGGLKAFDAATGQPSITWPQGVVNPYAMTLSGTTLYIGGPFSDIGGTPRKGVAALDATTGALLPWNPGLSNASSIHVLKAQDSTVWAGGSSLYTDNAPASGLIGLPK